MNKRVLWSILIVFNGLLMGLSILFFTSGIDFSAEQRESGIKIGACYGSLENTYYNVLNKEISAVVVEHGDMLLTRSGNNDQEEQNRQIEALLKEGIKGLFVTAVDSSGIAPVLEKARERGVVVIAVDTPLSQSEWADCTVTSDNMDAGVQLANYLMTQKQEARITVLGLPESEASRQRIQGFKTTLEKNESYKIVNEVSYDGQIEAAMKAVTYCMEEGKSFDTVFAVNDRGVLGAFSALQGRKETEKTSLLGVDGSPSGKQKIKEGQVMVTAAQFPGEIGNQAAAAMYQLLNGQSCTRQIKVPVKLITKYTINSYDTEKWQ